MSGSSRNTRRLRTRLRSAGVSDGRNAATRVADGFDHPTTQRDAERAVRTVVVEPGKAWAIDIAALWEHRETLGFLIWRDIKVRYRQTIFGGAWAILQPLLLMLAFAVFAQALHVKSNGVPYPIFAFAALVPWTLFSSTVNAGSGSVVKDNSLISKVYFPRLIIPIAASLSYLLDYVVGLLTLAVFMIAYGITPPLAVLVLAPVSVLLVVVAVAAAILLSALNVMYRDIRAVVPFLTQLWLFASPVAYSISTVPERFRTVYAVNPLVTVITVFRWGLFGVTPPSASMVATSVAATVVLLICALLYFRRTEDVFADVI
jgi:lipopolysaccharide transport system permease protein